MITALFEESLVTDALYKTIGGRMDGHRFSRLTRMVVRCVDEYAGSYHWIKDTLMVRSRLLK